MSKLEGAALARKKSTDQELEAIIRGRTSVFLVIGPCSSDNEEAVLEYAKRLSTLQEEVKDRIFYGHASIQLNLVPMEMAIGGLDSSTK